MPAPDKIRVLIVDDIAETRENLKRMLQFDQNIEVVAAARTGREAIELTQQFKPEVVLMDINMPDMDGISATEAIRKKTPTTQVVILSVQSDSNYMLRAMLAGARDFLAKPPMIDELIAAIRRAGTMAQEERAKVPQAFSSSGQSGSSSSAGQFVESGKTIMIYSPKGGVGTTTIATNLAIVFNSETKRCVLVDGNLQFGDVAVFLNEQGKNTVLDLTPRVDELDPEVVQDVMVIHADSNLNVLAAPPSPELADSISGEQFSKLLTYLKRLYAYTVIDTASYLTDSVQASMEIADLIVLITTQEIPSIKNANLFLTLADKVGIRRDHILFIMNKYDKRIAIAPEKIGESLRQPILLSIPLDERIVSSSVNRGMPFVIDNKAAPITRSIQALASLINEHLAKLESAAEESKKTTK
jgi:pilus assembly protein CpaE